jgi:hypothetical protein
MRRRSRDTLLSATLALAIAALPTGCQKKQAAVQDASPPSVAPASTPEVTELRPLTEDAGSDAAAVDAAIAKKPSGAGTYNANQQKIRQCCNAMRTQAKQLGPSPEANQLVGFATYCDTLAVQVGPQGTAPEFNQLRQLLKSITLPSGCQF